MTRRLDIFTIAIVGFFGFLLIITLLSMFYNPTPNSGTTTGENPRAIIVDSLGSNFINKEGVFEMIKILYDTGFTIDVKIGAEVNVGEPVKKIRKYVKELKDLVNLREMDDRVNVEMANITVNFYKQILKSKYQVYVLRVHSTFTPNLSRFGWKIPEGSVVIITQERYDKTKYVVEQFFQEQLLPSFTLNATGTPLGFGYFALTENFIKAQNVDLEKATIIVLGCHGLYSKGMAKAFIEKEALVYFGFDGYVSAPYADRVGAELLKNLFIEKKSIQEAISATMTRVGIEPHYKSELLVELGDNIKMDTKIWNYYFKQG